MSKVRQIQLGELSLLEKYIEICTKHNLRYYALGGHFIGELFVTRALFLGMMIWIWACLEKTMKISGNLPKRITKQCHLENP